MNEQGNIDSIGGTELVAERYGNGAKIGARDGDRDLTIEVTSREARAYAKQILAALGPESEDEPEVLWMGAVDSPERTHSRLLVEVVIQDPDVERAETELGLGMDEVYNLCGWVVRDRALMTEDHYRGWAAQYPPGGV